MPRYSKIRRWPNWLLTLVALAGPATVCVLLFLAWLLPLAPLVLVAAPLIVIVGGAITEGTRRIFRPAKVALWRMEKANRRLDLARQALRRFAA